MIDVGMLEQQCPVCHGHGRGKLLTPEGEKLIRFVRFWLNPNY